MKVERIVGVRELLVPVRHSRDAILDRLAARGVIQRGVGKPGNAERVKPRRGRRLLSNIVLADRR
ncbi:MAG: hypothetical protein ACRELS_05580 [Candidatus Rokuibacteriota bacterium]